MTTKHTPGPWTHHPEDNIILDASGRRLIEWQARSVSVSVEERDANARLIAAAPELLEALEVVLHLCTVIGAPDGPALDMARDALAKARGET